MPIYNPAHYKPIQEKDAFEGILDFTVKCPNGTVDHVFLSSDTQN